MIIAAPLASAASFSSESSVGAGTLAPGGVAALNNNLNDGTWTAISTPQQLALIGNSPMYPLNGKYYLANDIVFTSEDDTNGGIGIAVSVTVSGTSLTVTLTPPSGSITSLSAWMGASYAKSTSNSVTLSNIPQGVHTLVISGAAGPNLFAHSMRIDTVGNGMKVNNAIFSSNGNFTPIGPVNQPYYEANPNTLFTGAFDGNGHVISGLHIAVCNANGDSYAGLFGVVSGATITNLGLVGGSVTASTPDPNGSANAGGVAGMAVAAAVSATISNCYNTGIVAASTLGGIGSAAGISCLVTATEKGVQSVAQCYNTGPVAAMGAPGSYGAYAGGIVCGAVTFTEAYADVSDCYNTGPVYASGPPNSYLLCAGGIVGVAGRYMDATSGSLMTISNCYNSGPVAVSTNGSPQGMLVGGISGVTESSTRSTVITNCYFLQGMLQKNGVTVADVLYGGGLATVDGNSSGMQGSGAQWSGAKSATEMRPALSAAQSGNSVYCTGVTLVNQQVVQGWDFYNTWAIDPGANNGYPVLASSSAGGSPDQPGGGDNGLFGGNETVVIASVAAVVVAIIVSAVLLLVLRKP